MPARKSLTKDYRPSMTGMPLWGLFHRVAFDIEAVDLMILDSQVALSTSMFTAPLFMGQWIVRAKSKEVSTWVSKQLQVLQKSLGTVIQYLQYGSTGFEVLQEDVDGLIHVNGIKDFHPRDVKPLSIDGELSGIRVRGANSHATDGSTNGAVPGHAKGSADIRCNRGQALWLAHKARHGSFFGTSIYQAAFYPWLEKVQKDGAEDIRRLWFYKNAYNGDVLRFPVDDFEDVDGVVRSMKDIAQQLVEVKKTGGQWTLPSTKDEHGNYEWDVHFAAMGDAATGLLAYGDKLDVFIARGIGLPDDVLSNPDTSSTTYGGRRIGWEAMLTALQQIWMYVLASQVKQIIKPLAATNFGADERFEVIAYPLIETIRKAAKSQQQHGQQQQSPGGMPGMPGMPGMQQPGGMPGQMGGMPGMQPGSMPSGNGEPQEGVRFGFDDGTPSNWHGLMAGGMSGTVRLSVTEWEAWGFSKFGTPRWRSLRTGRVIYQHERPGEHEDHDAPSQDEPAPPKALDPHEMTQAQYLEHKAGQQRPAQLKRWHQDHVRAAMKAGRHVPEHVLADYPNLTKKKETKAAPETNITPGEQPTKGSTDDELARKGSEDQGGRGLRGTERVGDKAGEASQTPVSGPGEGTGSEPAGVRGGAGAQRGGTVPAPTIAGDGPADGVGAGGGGTSAKTGGRSGSSGGVGVRRRTRRDAGESSGLSVEPQHPGEESVNEEPATDNPTDVNAGNFKYTDLAFLKAGAKAKYKYNLDAIRTLKKITDEGRTVATPAEQEILSRYVGWGAYPALFNSWNDPEWRAEMQERVGTLSRGEWEAEYSKWDAEREELKSLVTEEEWDSFKRSTLNAHFTSPEVVDAHWKMADRLGFKGGRFLETSAGIGYYLGMMPEYLAGKVAKSAIELDTVTGNMLKLLYPSAHVQVQGFQDHAAPDGFYHLVASNVPFGKYGVYDKRYNRHDASIHDYFFLKSADLAAPGGLVMHITSTGTMDKADSKIREELAKTCDLVSAVRFPSGTHKQNAGTEVVTDLLILRKRHPNEQPVSLEETPPEALPNWKKGQKPEPGQSYNELANLVKGTGFTGITTDSLGRLYHWKDGKRVPGPDWMGVTTVPDPAGGEAIPINKYFADHPEQILGTLDRSGTMYRINNVNVSLTDDYAERLQAAIDRLPAGLMKEVTSKEAFHPSALPAPDDVKDSGFKIIDGKLYVREGNSMVQRACTKKDLVRIEAMLGILGATRATINAQVNGEDATSSREQLNKLYDAFVSEYGPLNKAANSKLFRGNDDGLVLLALELYDPKKPDVAKKSDIFVKDTIRRIQHADHADNVTDGFGISLHETGSVDVDRIAELTGKSKVEVANELVKSGLAFRDPMEGWKPADQYLSGNVRRKLVAAKAAAASDPAFKPNVEALLAVQPADIDYDKIDVKLGAGWVPPSDIAAFAAHLLGGEPGHFEVGYNPGASTVAAEWNFDYSSLGERKIADSKAARKLWGMEGVSFKKLMSAALNNQPVIVYFDERDENDKPVVDKDMTDQAAVKVQEIKDAFKEWVWEGEERRNRLHRFYNDNFNNIRPFTPDGSHQSFPGMNPSFKMRDFQRNFVWRVVSTGTGLAAHEVGTGKTTSMVAAAMELRRLGLARKPAIACLKANIESITAEAQRLYPGARILSTVGQFDAKNRKKTIARMATGDYDMVILTHDHLNLLKMKPDVVAGYIREEIRDLEAAMAAAEAEDKDSKQSKTGKDLEKKKLDLEVMLRKALDMESKDNAVFFEETGIDHLMVDEGHKFKALPCYTKQSRVKGIPTRRSQRATDMFMRTRWLLDKNNGRGVVFATGTPVTNTMAELYNMQRFLQPRELKERGIWAFDAWANQFGEIVTKGGFTVTGDYTPQSRFANFTNLPELQQLTSQFMDVIRVDDVPPQARPTEENFTGETKFGGRTYAWENGKRVPIVVRPKRHDHVVAAPRTDAMTKLMDELRERGEEVKKQGKAEKGMDNMLKICTDGRKGSLDMRLLDDSAPDDPNSKLNHCVKNVLDIFHKGPPQPVPPEAMPKEENFTGTTTGPEGESYLWKDGKRITTQLIFSNLGVNTQKKAAPKVKGDDDDLEMDTATEETDTDTEEMNALLESKGNFRLYQDIIDKLVAGGIPREKIADFSKLEGDAKKAAQDGMNNGDILVALGSTEKLGTGVNVQKLVSTMHHLDVPWIPADIEQRDGRGWRHGNQNKHVNIVRYVAEGSLDQLMWDIVSRKAHFINQVVGNQNKERTIQDEDTSELTPEQLMAASSGDPRVVEKVRLDDDLKMLSASEGAHRREQIRLKKDIAQAESELPDYHGTKEKLSSDIKHLESNPDFVFTINDKRFTERDKDARKQVTEQLSKLAHEADVKYQEAKEIPYEYVQGKGYVHKSKPEPAFMGTYRGMKLFRHEQSFYLEGPSGETYPTGEGLASIEATVRGLPKKRDEYVARVAKVESDLEMMRKKLGKPFPKEEEISAKRKRLKELETELGMNEESGKPVTDAEATSMGPVELPDLDNDKTLSDDADDAGRFYHLGKKIPNKMQAVKLDEGTDNETRITGYKVGPFLVHNVGGKRSKAYRVTHIGTGGVIATPGDVNTAKALAAILSQAGNYNFKNIGDQDDATTAWGAEVMRAYRNRQYSTLLKLGYKSPASSLVDEPGKPMETKEPLTGRAAVSSLEREREDIPEAEEKAIRLYTAFQSNNPYLEGKDEEVVKKASAVVSERQWTFAEPVLTYRGLGMPDGGKSIKVGSIIDLPGLTSTSINRDIAEAHSSKADANGEPVIFVVTARRGFYVGFLSAYQERELLMVDTKWKVVRKSGNEVHVNQIVEFDEKPEELEAKASKAKPVPAVLHGKPEAIAIFNNLASIPTTSFQHPDDDDEKAALAMKIDAAMREHAPARWRGDDAREKQVLNALFPIMARDRTATQAIFEIIKNQSGY